jgi:hypothetical protein
LTPATEKLLKLPEDKYLRITDGKIDKNELIAIINQRLACFIIL